MKFTFAEQVRTILRRRGWSVEKLAAALGTSKQNLNQQLLRDNFKETDARRIAEALGYDMEIILTPRAEAAGESGGASALSDEAPADDRRNESGDAMTDTLRRLMRE